MVIKSTSIIPGNQNITDEASKIYSSKKIVEKNLILNSINAHSKKKEATLTLSKEALKRMKEEMEQIRESNSEAKKDISTTSKCMRIASRIVQGDTVPVQDIKYLMKHDMELYGQSMKMRIPKEDPKEWDSELSDEELKEIEQSGLSIGNIKVLSVNIIPKDM